MPLPRAVALPESMKTTQPTAHSERCTICLVRHGETAWNAERRLQGHIDIPLNDRGLAQAENTARHLELQGQRFDALYCSDLQRARQTATAVMRRQGLVATHDLRLRERHYGLFQGLTHAEAERLHPELHHRFRQREFELAFPEQGESLAVFSRRVHEAMHEIARRHPGERVLVVTHGGVLDIVHRLVTGAPLAAPRKVAIPNAALNWIEHTAGQWQLLAWADETHLRDALDELPEA